MKHVIAGLVVAGMVLLAGCSGGTSSPTVTSSQLSHATVTINTPKAGVSAESTARVAVEPGIYLEGRTYTATDASKCERAEELAKKAAYQDAKGSWQLFAAVCVGSPTP